MPSQKKFLLILDRDNVYGSVLASHLAPFFTAVLVTKEQIETEDDTIVVPYISPVPQIPDGWYEATLFVWSKKEAHLLEPLMQKARSQGTKLFVVLPPDEVPEEKDGAVWIKVGDVFGQERKTALDGFLEDAKKTKKISLPHMGLRVWHPVLYADVVAKLADLMQSKDSLHKKLFIGPAHEYTALSVAHALQKVDPDLIVDFSQEKIEEKTYEKNWQEIFAHYDALGKLQSAYKSLVVTAKKTTKDVSVAAFSQPKRKRSRWGFYWLYILLLILCIPVIFTVSCGVAGTFLFFASVREIKTGNVSNSLMEMRAAETNFSITQVSLNILTKELALVGQGKLVSPVQKQLQTMQVVGNIVENGEVFYESTKEVLTGKTLSPQVQAGVAVSAARQATLLLQTISVNDFPEPYRQDIKTLQNIGNITSGIIESLPAVLGVDEQKTYLILFQNNMELRPGGGFIGSYGLLTLKNGAVKDFSIHDVYDADGQLKGHVEPPFALRRYMPIVHLYLRDSNFDPDFTKNAQTAAFLLSDETGIKVDGVVGVDLNTLKTLLVGFGSVYVPSYGETVTDKNFFTLIEKHAEKDFFPGSTQKKDFLQAFAKALLAKAQQGNVSNVSSLLGSVYNLLSGKDILVALADPSSQKAFSLAGLSGVLPDSKISTKENVYDFSGLVEANLGVNKVNAFITRNVAQQVRVDAKGNLLETQTLTLTNNSDGSWPGGVYKNFLRFALPQAAVLEHISINSVGQKIIPAIVDPKTYEAKSFIAPKGLEVTKEEEAGKTLYGFLVTVPTKSTMTIAVSYTIPQAFSLSDKKQTYTLSVWKQAGVDGYPDVVSFTIPDGFQFLTPNASDQTVNTVVNLSSDTDTVFVFAKK